MSDESLVYGRSVYTPEAILSSWLNLSFLAITVSLLFYHMTRVKSLEMDSRVAGLFSILLIGVSVAYTIFAVKPYMERLSYVIEVCKKRDNCNDEQVKQLETIRIGFSSLGIITVIIEVGIAYVIASKTLRVLF